jgi:hypothetical protein
MILETNDTILIMYFVGVSIKYWSFRQILSKTEKLENQQNVNKKTQKD